MTQDKFSIVRMSPEHLDDVCAIERECFSDPWSKNIYANMLSDPSYQSFVAVVGGRAVGYASMQTVLDEGYIGNIAVTESRRKQGVADRLIGALCDLGEEKSLSFLTLEVRESNLPARKLYEKHGFIYVGRRPSYYLSPVEDALLMTKSSTKSLSEVHHD